MFRMSWIKPVLVSLRRNRWHPIARVFSNRISSFDGRLIQVIPFWVILYLFKGHRKISKSFGYPSEDRLARNPFGVMHGRSFCEAIHLVVVQSQKESICH